MRQCMATNKPKRPACRCPRLGFPHRYDWRCAQLEDEQEEGCDEFKEERRLDERERARHVNEIQREVAK